MFGAAAIQAVPSPSGLSSDACELLGTTVCRTLCDKQYEKRKVAALEIEQIVRNTIKQYDHQEGSTRVGQILLVLNSEFLDNPLSNIRKGGLIGLASCAIALERNIVQHQKNLVVPIINAFIDPEPRVRYYACESLYNVCKVARRDVLLYFNEIFDGLCKIYADVDVEVKHGSEYLDRLLKELVTQSPDFDKRSFLPLLSQKVKVKNPHIRQLVLSWIQLLENIAGADLCTDVPKFLEGVFSMLSDSNRDVRQSVLSCLTELLASIKRLDLGSKPKFVFEICSLVVPACHSTDTMCRFTALCWLNDLLGVVSSSQIKRAGIVPMDIYPQSGDPTAQITDVDAMSTAITLRDHSEITLLFPQLLGAVLYNIDDPDDDMRLIAASLHTALFLALFDFPNGVATFTEKFMLQASRLHMLPAVSTPCDVSEQLKDIIPTLLLKLRVSPTRPAVRSACLQWTSLLLHQMPVLMRPYLEQMLQPLLSALDDVDAPVAADALRLLALISAQDGLFQTIVKHLLVWLADDSNVVSERSRLVIRQMSSLTDSLRFYSAIATEILNSELPNTRMVVHNLNITLLTAKETRRVREEVLNGEGGSLFLDIIRPWLKNGVATLALALWAQEFELSVGVAQRLSTVEPTVEFLMELDQLVNLLETPAFSRLRLLSLDTIGYSLLAKTLLNIAMLLPQASALETISKRLQIIQLSSSIDSMMALPSTVPCIGGSQSIIAQPYTSRAVQPSAETAESKRPRWESRLSPATVQMLLQEFAVAVACQDAKAAVLSESKDDADGAAVQSGDAPMPHTSKQIDALVVAKPMDDDLGDGDSLGASVDTAAATASAPKTASEVPPIFGAASENFQGDSDGAATATTHQQHNSKITIAAAAAAAQRATTAPPPPSNNSSTSAAVENFGKSL